MSTAELRRRLIEKIQSTTDMGILEEMFRLLEIESSAGETITVSPEQKKKIDKGLKEIEAGHYSHNDQANKEVEEWLKK